MRLHHYKGVHNDSYFYVVAFPTPNSELSKEIQKWCYQSYGEPGYRFLTDEIRWSDDIRYGEIYLSRESDLSLFVLRWS